MLGRRLVNCAQKLQTAVELLPGGVPEARKARRMFTESIRQMKKIGDDIENVVEILVQCCRATECVASGALVATTTAVKRVEEQLAHTVRRAHSAAKDWDVLKPFANMTMQRNSIERQLSAANLVGILSRQVPSHFTTSVSFCCCCCCCCCCC